MLQDETFYDILSVSSGASSEEITIAYRKLAKMLHPDVCKSPDAEELFKAVNEAYRTLRDPHKRAEYDASIVQVRLPTVGMYHQGTHQYRHPRTWYYAHHNAPRREHAGAERTREQQKKRTLPRFIQVVLFYLTILMAIGIFAQLFLLPWIAGVNASEARIAFNEGNRWMEEQEYQKAIESFQAATYRLPSFSEAWRAKGLAEMKKADELAALKKPDAEQYYRDAIRSFSRLEQSDADDIVVIKALATALMNTGGKQQAFSLLTSEKASGSRDPEIQALIRKFQAE